MHKSKSRVSDADRLIGERLKIRRILLGVTQTDLGKATGVSIQQIQKYEQGANRVSGGRLFTFANFLKVPIDYFFKQEDIEYTSDGDGEFIPEKEMSTLIKVFSKIQDSKSRKRVVTLIKELIVELLDPCRTRKWEEKQGA